MQYCKSEASGGYLHPFFGCGVPQHITATPHGFDVVFAARGASQLLTQLAHEHIDYLHFRLVYSTIEVVQEHFLGKPHPLAKRKELQHRVLLAGKMHARTVDFACLGIEVDYEVVSLNDRLGVALRASYDGVDARDQFFPVERLGHGVVRADAESLDLVLDSPEAGKD